MSNGIRIEDHLPMLRSVAKRVARNLPPTVDVEDLVHQGVLGLIHAAERYDPARNDSFEAYAYPRVCGSMHELFRRKKRWILLTAAPLHGGGSIPSEQDLEQEAIQAERAEQIRAALAKLRPLQRRVIECVVLEGLSQTAAAEVLGIKLERLKSLHWIALDALRQSLGHLRPTP